MELASIRSLVAPVAFPVVPLDELERKAVTSKAVAWMVIAGLPALGFLASLYAHLPLFAGLMAACFLLATALVCRLALVRFVGRTMRLLVTARLVIVLVLGGLLFCTTGATWTAVVSSVLLWLVTERLLSKSALTKLAGHAGNEERAEMMTEEDDPAAASPAPVETTAADAARSISDPSNRLFSATQDEPVVHTARSRRKGSCKS